MARWVIPEPLPVDWPMRTLDSAKVTVGILADGRFRQTVKHAPLPGAVTKRVVRHRMGFLQRWQQHNVEEAGSLPHFLPELYAQESS